MGSSHKGNPKEIIRSVFFMLNSGVLKGAKTFHIFGVSNAEINIYFAALKHAIRNHKELDLNFDITFDSSYPLRSAAFMQYFMYLKDTGFSSTCFTNRVDWKKMNPDAFKEGFFCDCPVCSTVKDFHGMMNAESTQEQSTWCAYHNLYSIKQYMKKVDAIVEMCYPIEGLLDNFFPAKIARNIKTIYEAVDNMPHSEFIISNKFVAVDVDNSANLNDFFG
jgi:hypothetical protein